MRKTTRRGLLGALGVAGLASLGSSGASANLGGGPEAGAMTDYQVPYFRVPESDLDTPGVVGRRVEITAGGSSYETGDQLVDTGTSWERVSAGYDSLSAKEIDNIFFAKNFPGSDGGEKIQNAWGTAEAETGNNAVVITPNGPDNPSSAPESDVWLVDSVAPIDPEGYHNSQLIGIGEPMLFLGDGVENDIIRTAVDDSGVVTEDVTIKGIRFHGNRANNTTFGSDPESGASYDSGNANIKGLVGIRPVNCAGWTIEDCHFQSFTRFGYCGKLTKGKMTVKNTTADNCGDDGFTVSNQFHNVQDPDDASHLFDDVKGTECGDQGLEIEDGARNCTIKNSTFARNNQNGATVKTHENEAPCDNVYFENCRFVNNPNGFHIYGPRDGKEGHTRVFDGCTVIHPSDGNQAVKIGQPASDDTRGPVRNLTIRDTDIVMNGGSRAINFPGSGGKFEDVEIDVTIDVVASGVTEGIQLLGKVENIDIDAEIRGNGNLEYGIRLQPARGDIYDFSISEDTYVEGCLGSGLQFFTDQYECHNSSGVGGTYKNNGQDTGKSDVERAGVSLTESVASSPDFHDIIFRGIRAYDDQSTKTQVYGILHQREDYNIFDDCNIRGNINGAFGGSAGTNTVKGTNIT